MAHHDRCIHECVIALAEKGGLSATTAGELYGIPMSTARELGYGAFPAQLRMLH